MYPIDYIPRGVRLTAYGGESTVWVPETPHTSRDLLILVEQPTEPVVPPRAVRQVRW
jgi:hypothetical protein